MIVKKGNYGYIRNRKILMVCASLFMMAVILIMYFGAKAHFGTNRNLFTIFAALCCIPAGKSIVSTIMYLMASGCPADVRDAVEAAGSAAPSAYDLYMTSYSENYVLWHVTVSQKCVLVLMPPENAGSSGKAGAGKKKGPGIQEHIKGIFSNDSITGWTVHAFRDVSAYTNRIAGSPSLSAGEQRVMEILHAVSL